jgi:uncharacterized membrane protein YfcA
MQVIQRLVIGFVGGFIAGFFGTGFVLVANALLGLN